MEHTNAKMDNNIIYNAQGHHEFYRQLEGRKQNTDEYMKFCTTHTCILIDKKVTF